jgi:ABC-type transporter Mla subunit MlaD
MDQCTISGSEVFHRRCVQNIEDSIGHQRQRRVHDLTQALEQAGRTIRQLERGGQQVARSAAAAVDAVAQLTSALSRSESALAQAAAEAVARQRRHDEELAKLRSERDIARAETAIAASHNPEPAPADNPESDDASTRFSLLELDR